MQLIDTHAHLDAFFDENGANDVISRAATAFVPFIICCSARVCDWQNFANLAKKNKGKIFWQIGLHPTEIEDFSTSILDETKKFFECEVPPVSIGEIGLDFYQMQGTNEEIARTKIRQEEFFRAQLEIAKNRKLPVCVHARNAVSEAIKIIDESKMNWNKVVFHCFSGTVNEVRQINERGGRVSFTGIITFKNADTMRETMLAQGLSKIMFETDTPYLSPVPFRGSKNEPSRIPLIAQKAADLFGISLEEIAEISTKNAAEFFNLTFAKQ